MDIYNSVRGNEFVEKFGPGPKIGELVLQRRIELIKKLKEEMKVGK